MIPKRALTAVPARDRVPQVLLRCYKYHRSGVVPLHSHSAAIVIPRGRDGINCRGVSRRANSPRTSELNPYGALDRFESDRPTNCNRGVYTLRHVHLLIHGSLPHGAAAHTVAEPAPGSGMQW